MIPVKDENPTRSFPFFNTLLIMVNISIFVLQIINPAMNEYLIMKYSMIPAVFISNPVSEAYRLVTYSFLHGGFYHIIGNMLFLYIFGDNIEDVFGHLKYILFYLVSAVIGVLTQTIFSISSNIPIIGASGAISAVITAYMLIFPMRRVVTLVFLGFFIIPVRIPALFYIALWIVHQISGSFFSLLLPVMGGIAYLVHLGGIISGYFGTKILIKRKKRRY
jgi:membrane associated rhomboid family serine protease